LEGEADGPALGVVVSDAVLGQHRPLGVAVDVTHSEPGVAQTGTDMSVPGHLICAEATRELENWVSKRLWKAASTLPGTSARDLPQRLLATASQVLGVSVNVLSIARTLLQYAVRLTLGRS